MRGKMIKSALFNFANPGLRTDRSGCFALQGAAGFAVAGVKIKNGCRC
jgi:hypothetical protein